MADLNINELLIKAEKVLDNYEKLSGIPEFSPFNTNEIDRYFRMRIEQLNKLTAMECAEGAYMLAQYSFYLQRMYNRESAKHRWATDKMAQLVCDKMADYDTYMKYEHKVSLIAKENNVVEKLRDIISYTSQVMERLNFLSTSVKNMGEVMSNIQKARTYGSKADSYGYQ
jgi:hypothetical protein